MNFEKDIEKYIGETAEMLNKNEKIMGLMNIMKNRAETMCLSHEDFENFKRSMLLLAVKIRAEVNPESTKEMAHSCYEMMQA